MKPLAVTLLAISVTIPLAAQPSPPRYKVLPHSGEKAAPAQWNAAADQGYRFLFEGRLAVMRLDTAPPDTYRYQPLPDRNLRATFLNALNEQGAYGYAWLSQTKMLEKLPHPRTWEYTVVEGFADKTRKASLHSLEAQGYKPVGLFGSVAIYMHETSPDPASSPSLDLRVVERANRKKFLREVVEAGRQGYRYAGERTEEHASKLVMERCGAACGAPFEYREVKFKTAAELEQQLNTLGSQGFRVVAGSLGNEPLLVERSAAQTSTYMYRVSSAKDSVAVEQTLNAGDRDGFVPVGFAVHLGWTADVMLVLEKPTAANFQAQ